MSRQQPPAWMRPGALADFHSRVAGPITHPARLITSEPWRLGSGDWVIKLDGIVGCVSVDAITPARPSAEGDPADPAM